MQNNTRKVLLIDDNEIDLKINSRIISLTQIFESIITCHSGEEALSYIHRHLNQPEALPDFILLDIQMPEMDGFEFLEHFKILPAHFIQRCPIAMLSSTLDFGDITRAEANPYIIKLLKKPLNPAELSALFI